MAQQRPLVTHIHMSLCQHTYEHTPIPGTSLPTRTEDAYIDAWASESTLTVEAPAVSGPDTAAEGSPEGDATSNQPVATYDPTTTTGTTSATTSRGQGGPAHADPIHQGTMGSTASSPQTGQCPYKCCASLRGVRACASAGRFVVAPSANIGNTNTGW